MNTEQIVLLCVGTFAGRLAFGLTGFAYGVVASPFLHHAFDPREVIFIMVTGGLWLNPVMLPRFWRDIDFKQALPFLAGATFGIPLGLFSLQNLSASTLRLLSCSVVIAYCLFALLRHGSPPLQFSRRGGQAADTGVGFAGGLVAGVAGMGPLIPSVWYGLRGKDKNESRGLMQPFALYVQSLMVAWFFSSSASAPPLRALAFALPLMLLGAWVGVRLFNRISLSVFRISVVWLSLAGAVILLARQALG